MMASNDVLHEPGMGGRESKALDVARQSPSNQAPACVALCLAMPCAVWRFYIAQGLYFVYWPLTSGIVSKVKPLGKEMTTFDQLQSRIAKLQKQAEDLMRKKASSVIADIRKLMAEHGLTLADLEANTAAPKTGAKRGPKPAFKRAGKAAARRITPAVLRKQGLRFRASTRRSHLQRHSISPEGRSLTIMGFHDSYGI